MDSQNTLKTPLHKDEPTLREQLEVYFRNWYWFVISVIVALTILFIYLRYTTPLYQAQTSIIIKDSQGRGAASEISAFKDVGLISGMNSNTLENEIELLKSRRLIKKVIEKLDLNIQYFVEGKIKTTELFTKKPFVIKAFNDEGQFSIPTGWLDIKIKSRNNFQYIDEKFNIDIEGSFGAPLDLPYGSVTLIPIPEVINSINFEEDFYTKVLITTPDNLINYYKSSLEVIPIVTRSTVIQLSLSNPVREKAEAFLNELVTQYNQDAIIDNNQVANNTADFIDKRLRIITSELDSVEVNKVKFKQENNLTNIESESQMFLMNTSELNKRQLNLSIQKKLVEDTKSYLAEGDLTKTLPADLGIDNSGGLSSLINNYNQLVLERNKMLRSSTKKNPTVINLSDQIEQLRGNVETSLSNMERSLETSLANLKSEERNFDNKISKASNTEKELRKILRQQNIKEELYLFLLGKREEIALSLAVTAPKAKIIDKAYSSSGPISPRTSILRLVALLLGLSLPILVIYLHQLLYNKISSRKDVEKLAPNIPFIAEIPKLSSKQEELIQKNDTSVLAESFRILRTNLQYLFTNIETKGKGKTIFLTSTVKGEGKTFASINLAITLANVGKKVILIGADIRNPKLHKFTDFNASTKGLTDYLVQKDTGYRDFIQKSNFSQPLDILFSGSIPPNPAELLLSERVGQLFEELREQYDYVIVDTAPSMLVTDTLLINHHADITLYVIRADYTESRLIEFPVDCVETNKLNNVSFILNNVKLANFGYGNKYGYSYGVETKNIFQRLLKYLFR